MKKYYGIIFAVVYAMLFRVLVEFNIIDFNSVGYLLIVPLIMGYLPFLLDPQVFAKSSLKAVFFPLISSFLFLFFAFKARFEDLGCLIILLPPYALASVSVSLILRYFIQSSTENKMKNTKRNTLFIIVIPILLGHFEKYIEKQESNFQVSKTIKIDAPREVIWNNLASVPELTNYIDNSLYNYLGFPNPVKSEYNSKTNTRLGYFDNGIILNEKIIESDQFKKMSFSINVDKSELDSSQTFKHVLKNKNLVFSSITYQLEPINKSQTKLTLVCDYKIRTNVPFYGEFCSKNIISDFENKLLNALKKRIEK
ncbi:hypothetical protein IRZ71_05250 [Flavobacterium sp. ANB]|uniref:hypothetical protein n=1 Tax=unclassified Flavobacterium TaxID=196869 RepID=UPI0012B738B8|nr:MULTISPECIES: hypothetical protein [unclassified Flavobacterium]MBF4515735.1 hypothetical protein [Flavobacterium sp. ANB]MTD68738.1 hypothetical protein [Flavobacterium sp. LC2016-13]